MQNVIITTVTTRFLTSREHEHKCNKIQENYSKIVKSHADMHIAHDIVLKRKIEI